MQIEEIIDFLRTDKLSYTFTDKGLCYLSLKDCRGKETVDLEKIIENEEIPTANASLVIAETSNFLETGSHNMKLDLSGLTPFQQATMAEVSKVQKGKTCTYKELAEKLGKPGGAQAVGGAISKNPVSYFIPTHRILPQKGLNICKSGTGFLREKLLIHEGHDINKISSNIICGGKHCERHGIL